MASRFQRPDTTTLKISNGDTLIVKRRLNAGEDRERRRMRTFQALTEVADTVAHLVDWSIVDDEGKHVPIAGVSQKELIDRIDALNLETYDEVLAAVKDHVAAMRVEREQEKNAQGDGTKSPATSASPVAVAGA